MNRLITPGNVSQFNGFIVAGPIGNGDLVNKSSLQALATTNGKRAMSIPCEERLRSQRQYFRG